MEYFRSFRNCALIILIGATFAACKLSSHKGTVEKPLDVVIKPDENIGPQSLDEQIGVFEVELSGDVLKINFGDHGSCYENQCYKYQLSTSFAISKTNPPQLILTLNNVERLETGCNYDVACTQYFNLKPLKKWYKNGKFDYEKVILNINNKNYVQYSLTE